MPDYDRRADDQWRGEVTERVRSVAESVRDLQADRQQLSDDMADIRMNVRAMQTEQKAMRGDMRDLGRTIAKDAEKRAEEREDLIDDLQETLRQKGLNNLQWALLIIGAFLTAVVGPLVVAALTGHLG